LRTTGPDIFQVNLFCFFKISPHIFFSEKNPSKS